MRIVAGEARGRNLETPSGLSTRPTSDRVRESIFNMLFSLGATEGARVLDLYAGCGALGLEALSRGAAHCTMVEHDRKAVACIRSNIEAIGYGDRTTIVQTDVSEWLATDDGRYDLVLADPPYADTDWSKLLDAVDARWFVAEAGGPLDAHPHWDVVRDKSYGTTVVTVLRRNPVA